MPCLCRDTIPEDHPQAATIDKHVTQMLVVVAAAVLAAATEASSGTAATAALDRGGVTADGRGDMDSDAADGAAPQQSPNAAALLNRLCEDAAAAPWQPEARRSLRVLLCLLQRAGRLPPAARLRLAQLGLSTALAAAGYLLRSGGKCSSGQPGQGPAQDVLCFLAVCCADRCDCTMRVTVCLVFTS